MNITQPCLNKTNRTKNAFNLMAFESPICNPWLPIGLGTLHEVAKSVGW